jgi:hypothetical protein
MVVKQFDAARNQEANRGAESKPVKI